MNDRYERIGEAREPEFPDEPVHAPEFGNATGGAPAGHQGAEHHHHQQQQYVEGYEQEYDEDAYEHGSSNGVEAENGFVVSPSGDASPPSFSQGSRPHGPTAFEEPASPLLLEPSEIDSFKLRWPEIKATFVDDPRDSVRLADAMLAQVTELIARRVGEERAHLESEWNGRNDVTTEDLRQSLHKYQVFFDRLTNT